MTVIDADHDHGSSSPDAPRPGGSPGAARLTRFMSSPWRLALVAVGAVLVVDAGGTDDGAGVCVFRRCTDGYCPGCGMTRAARHLTRGELSAAWHDHPMVVLLAIQIVVAGALSAAFTGVRRRLAAPRSVAIVASINAVLLLVIWVVRLIDGSIPRFF